MSGKRNRLKKTLSRMSKKRPVGGFSGEPFFSFFTYRDPARFSCSGLRCRSVPLWIPDLFRVPCRYRAYGSPRGKANGSQRAKAHPSPSAYDPACCPAFPSHPGNCAPCRCAYRSRRTETIPAAGPTAGQRSFSCLSLHFRQFRSAIACPAKAELFRQTKPPGADAPGGRKGQLNLPHSHSCGRRFPHRRCRQTSPASC